MKRIVSLCLVGLSIITATNIINAEDRFISRVINNSNELAVTIAPVAEPGGSVVVAPAYTAYMHALSGEKFDVTFEKPIKVKSTAIITIGEKKNVVELDDLTKGKNALIIDKQGNISWKPASDVPGSNDSTIVKPEVLAPVAEENKAGGIRNTYIAKVINELKAETVLIAPSLHSSLILPTANLGYSLTGKGPAWREDKLKLEKLFIGSDMNNTELYIFVGEDISARLYPADVKNLTANSVLYIHKNGTIELRPA